MVELPYRFCRKSLWIISLVITGFLFVLNILYTSSVAYSGYEVVTVSFLPGYGVSLLLALALVTLTLFYGHTYLETADDRAFFRTMCLISSVFAAYLIFNVEDILRADPLQVYHAAQTMKRGEWTSLQEGGYLYRYPHQLGLVLYERLLFCFSENITFLFLMNFFLLLGINRNVWKLSQALFGDLFTNMVTIFLSFAFLPQLFFILFAYGLLPGFFFLSGGFLYAIRFVQTKNIRTLAAMAAYAGMAVILKQNYLIGILALVLYLLIAFLKERNLRLLAAAAALMVCLSLPGKLIQSWAEREADMVLDNPSPSILWLAMGTDIDNEDRGPGWYNSYSWQVYNAARFLADEAEAAGREKLAENWEKIKAEPDRAGDFFLRKTVSQWCDPMFQSVWSGPLEDCGQYTRTEILQSIYTGGTWEDYISLFAKWVYLAIWSFAIGFLLLRGRTVSGWEPMLMYLAGGLLFHTIWEGKSQYTYTYVFLLIPLAANGFRQISELFRKRFAQ